jgi:hypothetical protein
MQNITTERKGDKLILTIDVSKATLDKAPASKTGKTRIVASTHGFAATEGVKLNLTACV